MRLTSGKQLTPFGEFIAKIPWGAESQPEETLRFRWDKKPVFRATYQIGRSGVTAKEGRAKLAAIVGPKATDALMNSETRLMTWLAQDPAHAAAFALDPVGSMARAGIKLDSRTAARLRQHRAHLKRLLDPTMLAGIDSIKFEVADGREEE